MTLHLNVKILVVWWTDVLVLIPGTFQKTDEDVGKGATAWSRCEVVTRGMVVSVRGSVIRGREISEIESERENYMNVSVSCVNENRSGEEAMNVKSLGLQDLQ